MDSDYMIKLNNKGFTLVEVIGVVVIITILAIILIPNVIVMLNKQKKTSLQNVKDSILIASKSFVNDNRYNITVSGSSVLMIDDITISDGIIPVDVLIDRGYLKATYGDNKIINPVNKNKCLSNNPVKVTWNSSKKRYKYTTSNLIWGSCE